MFYCRDCNALCRDSVLQHHVNHDVDNIGSISIYFYEEHLEKYAVNGTIDLKEKTPLELIDIEDKLDEGIRRG